VRSIAADHERVSGDLIVMATSSALATPSSLR